MEYFELFYIYEKNSGSREVEDSTEVEYAIKLASQIPCILGIWSMF